MHRYYLSALRRYADYRGRARRIEYWMFVLVHAVIVVALATLSVAVADWLMYVLIAYYFATVVPVTALVARRLHDVGYSGWLQLINLLPFGFIVLLVFMALPGEPGPNRHGPAPAGRRLSAVPV
ncbi:DUF805 domain-containing protein [Actinoplanes sp. NPDC048791]|uniref:DUF805 domain-containing protein n=1 Tax=Actinoplanes sp. NPDC048791 TaxID=3154623 RepID=UPI0033FE82B9